MKGDGRNAVCKFCRRLEKGTENGQEARQGIQEIPRLQELLENRESPVHLKFG